ncbi:hypothetical protein Tco_0318067 [Tanacetum coccineum]
MGCYNNDGQTLEALNQRVIEQSSRYLDIHYVPFENNAISLSINMNGRGEGQWRLEDRNDLGKLMPRVMRGKLEAIIDGITKSKGEKITCIIADYCMGWISKVAQKMCIRLATFCSGSAAIMALIMSVHKLLDDQVKDNNGKGLITKSKFTTMNYGCYANSLLAGVSGSVSTSMDGVVCIARVGTSSGIGNNGTFHVGDVSHPPCSISAISAAVATSMENVGVSQVHSLGGSLPYVGTTVDEHCATTVDGVGLLSVLSSGYRVPYTGVLVELSEEDEFVMEFQELLTMGVVELREISVDKSS